MTNSIDELLADAHLRDALHEHSAVSSVYGREIAVQAALRVARRAWKLVPADVRPTFDVFTMVSVMRLRGVADELQYRLPAGCTTCLAYPSIKYFDAPLYGVDVLDQYIVDAPIPPGYRAIPSALFTPYLPHSPQRYIAIQERISPLPVWFFERGLQGNSLGVPVERARTGHMQLLQGDHKLDVLKHKTSLKMKISWPNYVLCSDKQIRGTANTPMHSLNRLAQLTASAVCNFIGTAGDCKVDGAPQRWSDIGYGPGEVNTGNVILLGIIFVSDGAAMPLLAAREQA